MKLNIPIFNAQQKYRAVIWLSFFHILIIAASNYFVQVPFEITLKLTALGAANDFSFHSTWGTLTFPFIFLATDLTVRVFGAKDARKIIFVVMFPALIVSYVVSVLFSESQFQGFNALTQFNIFVFRIAIASFAAYVVGQLLDVIVFNRLRQLKTWWIAPTSSMTFGSMLIRSSSSALHSMKVSIHLWLNTGLNLVLSIIYLSYLSVLCYLCQLMALC